MKLNKRLLINSEDAHLVDEKIVFELSAAGRGMLTIKGPAKIKDVVRLDIGYKNEMHRYFTGVVAKVTPAENGHSRLLVKELSFLLGQPCPISIQHATLRSVVARIEHRTGLTIELPADADYTDRPIPNFTSRGTGAQALMDAGRAFSVPEFCWFQQPGGKVWVGGWGQSEWAKSTIDIPSESLVGAAASESLTLPAHPLLRPGAKVNGEKITKVEFDSTNMAMRWQSNKKTPQRRQAEQDFPELAAGFHLPLFGRVVAVSDSAQAGQLNDPFRPRYAVDVQQLNEGGQPDESVPIYSAVPLPVLFGGPEQGQYQYPVEGTVVELGFAFGRADLPFVRTVLGTGWPLPNIAPGEWLSQRRDEVYQRTDAAGNHTLSTDQLISHISAQLLQEADDYQGRFGGHHLKVNEHSIEDVAGKKTIEALGAIDLLAGDSIDIATLTNLHLISAGERADITGGDYQSSVGGDVTTVAGGDATEQIQGNKTSIAQTQNIQGKSITLGNGTHNMLALMISMMASVQDALSKLDGHTHPNHNAPPNVKGQVASSATAIGTAKENLQIFTG